MRKSFMRIEQTNQDLLSFTILRNRRQSISPIAWGKHLTNNQPKKAANKPTGGGDLAVTIQAAFLDNINNQFAAINKKADGIDMTDFVIPKEEVLIVNQFLTKFVISTENAMKDQIDLRLMIEALPNKIMDYSFESIELFNFMIF